MDQTRFEFPDETPRRRRPRRPRASARRSRRRPAETLTLTATPVLQRCGRCGHEQTVLADTTVCAQCGGIMMRKEHGEDEQWPPLSGPEAPDSPPAHGMMARAVGPADGSRSGSGEPSRGRPVKRSG